MAKAVKVAFSERAEDQRRLRQAGGSIVFSKGKPLFQFPSMEHYREWQRLGAEAYKRKVAEAQ